MESYLWHLWLIVLFLTEPYSTFNNTETDLNHRKTDLDQCQGYSNLLSLISNGYGLYFQIGENQQ
jgi:hypothetical protein